jgi:hypothetical protein
MMRTKGLALWSVSWSLEFPALYRRANSALLEFGRLRLACFTNKDQLRLGTLCFRGKCDGGLKVIKYGALYRLLLGLIFSGAIASTAAGQSVEIGNHASRIRVLFIGNSFVYFHNMPAVLEAISNRSIVPRVVTKMVVSGGARLKDNWQEGAALSEIRKGGWDYVVLNEQSSLGDVLIVNQQTQIADPAHFWQYANLFDKEIRKTGAKTVILMTWTDKNAPLRSQQALDFAFVKFARASGAILAPVSLAWQRIRDREPGLNLYSKDDHHPSAEGSYLEACVLYATLTGQSPVGATSKINGPPVEEDEGKLLEGKTETLVEIPPAIARTLQRVAWDTSRKVKAEGGYPIAFKPPAVVLPTVTGGRRPSLPELLGVWRGPLDFYPNNLPIEIQLRISNDQSGLAATLHVFYKGARPDVEVRLEDFRVTDSGVSFTDPDGPNKGTIEFSGAFRAASLTGIAKTLMPGSDPQISVWGTWDLKKVN